MQSQARRQDGRQILVLYFKDNRWGYAYFRSAIRNCFSTWITVKPLSASLSCICTIRVGLSSTMKDVGSTFSAIVQKLYTAWWAGSEEEWRVEKTKRSEEDTWKKNKKIKNKFRFWMSNVECESFLLMVWSVALPKRKKRNRCVDHLF